MRLDEALQQIALDAGLDAAELIRFAAEDYVGGRDTGNWPGMSTFASEGQIIYALVRALRPARVIEVGVDSGGTSTHILTALEANGAGELWSVDINPECGTMVPEQLRHRWTFVNADALTVDLPDSADFIFEDGDHSYDFTFNILSRLKELNPHLLLSHDYYTHEVYQGFYVKQAFDEALPGAKGVKIDSAFTGLGYWVNDEYYSKLKMTPHEIDLSLLNDSAELRPGKLADLRDEYTAALENSLDSVMTEPKPAPKPATNRGRKSKAAR